MDNKTWTESPEWFGASWPADMGPAEAGLFYDRVTGEMLVGMRRHGGQWVTRPVPYTAPAVSTMDEWREAVAAHRGRR